MASQTSPLQAMVVPPPRLPEAPLPPPPSEQALQCPRCGSTDTKFCYYNNYSLSQPRHICKSCRRYWTKGGSLRNVPVGGGCRKYKKSTSKKTARFSSQFFAVNSAQLADADRAAAGLISNPVGRSLQFGEGQRHFPVVANCGGFSGFVGSPGGGIFLQTPENHGFEEIIGRGTVGIGGGGIVGPYEESAAKIESFSGGGGTVVCWGSQQACPENKVGSGSSGEGWAGLDTSTWQMDNNLEISFY